MKLFLIKGLISAVLLIGFVFGYGRFCDYFFTQKRFLDLSEKKQWVLAQEGGDWDYAILGSSRAFGAFDMNLLDSLTGMKGINIASDGSGFKDNYLILSLFLKSNSIDFLVLQVDDASLNSKESFSNEFHAFRFLPYWNDSQVQSTLKTEIPAYNNEITDLLPEWRYFYFNKYFSPKEVLRRWNNSKIQKDEYSNYAGGKGQSFQRLLDSSADIKIKHSIKTIAPEDWHYLNQLISLAKNKDLKLVAFVAPTFYGDNSFLKESLNELLIPIYFPDDFDDLNPELFYDLGHLNSKGRAEFTPLFAKFISSKI
ncbi:hypothetical protein [Algoriphagus taiwanensis]|uniref:Uncharacterized protein n=1 Tax=Algoriphagus taiwanensis TaxID=1445656 RepID=A0ABQ6Q731_9BACT|nr:hypothetical protein Ataiwa_40000 [Algoriphagus taiwanensis]